MPYAQGSLLEAETVSTALVGVSIALTLWKRSVPEIKVLDPCVLATAATVVVGMLLFRTRRRGLGAPEFERRLIATFLAGMPFVYCARAFVVGAQQALWLEAVGVPLFCAIALLGLLKSPWYLVAGMVSHGLHGTLAT
jgi:hypothetical protein